MFYLNETKKLRIIHLAYSLLIILLAFISISNIKKTLDSSFVLNIRKDYLIHFSLFVLWMALVHFAYRVTFKKNFQHALGWVFVGLVFCWFSEGIQLFIPYRSFNVNDLLANSIGIMSGSVFFFLPLDKKT